MLADTKRRRWLLSIAGVMLTAAGCATGPSFLHCDEDECGPKPGSDEWWAQKASDPVGARQKLYKGKLWPPNPRPTGDKQQFSHTYHAAHYWPHPYVCQDRAYVRQLWAEQTAAGWLDATTFYDYHFEADTGALNRPGRKHLSWILKSVPDSRRMAFVQATSDPAISTNRLDSVRNEAIVMVGESGLPPIIMRETETVGRPAIEVDAIRQGELATLPAPRVGSSGGIDTSGLSTGNAGP